jgi:hypothetical protein
VGPARLELARSYEQRILSPHRLPLRHGPVYMVREEGLEPSHLSARAPKTRVAAITPLARCGRGCRIRTDDLLRPRQALYQAELIPEIGC